MHGQLYRLIPIRRRNEADKFAIVDADEYEALVAMGAWVLTSSGYAQNWPPREGRKRKARAMHRVIVGLEHGDPRQVDHINGDRLDNRRANLRAVIKAQNAQNLRRKTSTSRFRGVSWDTHHQRWTATASLDHKHHNLGRFHDELEAARAAEEWRQEHMPYAQPDPALVQALAESPRKELSLL